MTKSWLGEPTAARGGRAKRHYAVTPKGEEALRMSREIRERLWTSVGVASS
jgi:DNA-binding PadR family transcriptional regulator